MLIFIDITIRKVKYYEFSDLKVKRQRYRMYSYSYVIRFGWCGNFLWNET